MGERVGMCSLSNASFHSRSPVRSCTSIFDNIRLLRGHTLLASPIELDIFYRTRCLVPSCECGSRFCHRWQVPNLLCRLHLPLGQDSDFFHPLLDDADYRQSLAGVGSIPTRRIFEVRFSPGVVEPVSEVERVPLKKKTRAMSSASEAVKNPDHCTSWKR
ncbi:unnamed protein product [Trichogramma brassicae]|uniref:Uncharacterized protein n=1 Tax=Trichogramma brassicae TaxID=86971 RepID=A0A6H5ILH4_9HYME|nr:unnamed protein product [Trichogramma brassicae]